ncbi:hypothetical protein PG993_000103 [Apiospora rasikravindrae]|uniref:Ankyrin n=1 Tax=Apiospora rasikravindrae TaxID=990691 RepID=A0ABR1U9M7_9PEZI
MCEKGKEHLIACSPIVNEKLEWDDEVFNHCCVGPDDPDRTFYDIIKRDDVAAFEAYLHAAHCFTRHRTIPYVRNYGMPWEVVINLGSVGVLEALLKYQDYFDGDYREGWDRSRSMETQWHRQLLFRAIDKGQVEVIRLDSCFREDLANDNWVDQCEEIITLLLDLGANAQDVISPESISIEGSTAGEDEEEQNVVFETTLSLTVARARLPIIKRLIGEGADVNARPVDDYDQHSPGTTMLHIASRHHNVAAVRFLLGRPEGPAMAQMRDQDGLQFRSDAEVTHHALETVKALLPYNDVNERGTRNLTALGLAARYRELQDSEYDAACYDPVVRLLLDHGADPCDAGGRDGDTPLHLALGCADRIETVRLLLSHGARADAANDTGDTPVHIAAGMHRYVRFKRREVPPDAEALRRREARQQNVIKIQREAMTMLLEALGGGSSDILDQPNQAGNTPRQIEESTTADISRFLEEDLKSRAVGQSIRSIGG